MSQEAVELVLSAYDGVERQDYAQPGRSSGIQVEFHYFQVTTVREGKITASRVAETRSKALAVVGVEG